MTKSQNRPKKSKSKYTWSRISRTDLPSCHCFTWSIWSCLDTNFCNCFTKGSCSLDFEIFSENGAKFARALENLFCLVCLSFLIAPIISSLSFWNLSIWKDYHCETLSFDCSCFYQWKIPQESNNSNLSGDLHCSGGFSGANWLRQWRRCGPLFQFSFSSFFFLFALKIEARFVVFGWLGNEVLWWRLNAYNLQSWCMLCDVITDSWPLLWEESIDTP